MPHTSRLPCGKKLPCIVRGLPGNNYNGQQNAAQTHVGLTETPFKLRFANHKFSFKQSQQDTQYRAQQTRLVFERSRVTI